MTCLKACTSWLLYQRVLELQERLLPEATQIMDFNDRMLRGRADIWASFPIAEKLPYLTVGSLEGMLCLQGATVLHGCFLLYTSFYKFAIHKLSVVRMGVCALGRHPGLGAKLHFPGLDLPPGCVDGYARLSLSTACERSLRQRGTPDGWYFPDFQEGQPSSASCSPRPPSYIPLGSASSLKPLSWQH